MPLTDASDVPPALLGVISTTSACCCHPSKGGTHTGSQSSAGCSKRGRPRSLSVRVVVRCSSKHLPNTHIKMRDGASHLNSVCAVVEEKRHKIYTLGLRDRAFVMIALKSGQVRQCMFQILLSGWQLGCNNIAAVPGCMCIYMLQRNSNDM